MATRTHRLHARVPNFHTGTIFLWLTCLPQLDYRELQPRSKLDHQEVELCEAVRVHELGRDPMHLLGAHGLLHGPDIDQRAFIGHIRVVLHDAVEEALRVHSVQVLESASDLVRRLPEQQLAKGHVRESRPVWSFVSS